MNASYFTSREELETEAKARLTGESVSDIASKYIIDQEKANHFLNSLKHKGNIGNIIEEALGVKINSKQVPDFENLGVELKVTPVEQKKDGTWKAGERLVITMISYNPEENEINGHLKSYEDTHLAKKLECILLCVYIRPQDHKDIDSGEYVISKVTLFTPPKEDMPIIERDWETIMSYVYQGRAEELSESLTEYLGACTKSSSSAVLKKQGYKPYTPAKPRAFCLKTSYMTYLHNAYIMAGISTYKPERLGINFENVALNNLNKYKGMLDSDIATQLGFSESNAKNYHSLLSFAMIGLKSNSCEEFQKANIVLKTIRFESTGKLKESISLPPSDFLSVFDEQSFEESALYEYFESTRFLLSVWKKEQINDKERCRFVGAKFWGMNGKDINGPLCECWTKTKDKLTNGVKLTPETRGKTSIITNDLPAMSDEGSIAHVRPHASLSYYEINGQVIKHNVKASRSDAFELPNGDWMPKQSFWLNSKYIKDIIGKV